MNNNLQQNDPAKPLLSQCFCPLCEQVTEFETFGIVPRLNARCPVCGSLERHRFAWLYLSQFTDLFTPLKRSLLHIAPESCLSSKFRSLRHLDYITGDLHDGSAMLKLDITNITYPEASFDIIFCSHVLEHVNDDQKAITELYRVLSSSGWAIIMVPITVSQTFEDPRITDPIARERVFGQHDHLRCYGPDFEDRLRIGGFHVTCVRPEAVAGRDEAARISLLPKNRIYFCRKH